MRSLLVNLDDSLDNLLAREKNQNEIVRNALRLYYSDITTSDIQSIKASFAAIKNYLKEIDSKADYIAARVQKEVV